MNKPICSLFLAFCLVLGTSFTGCGISEQVESSEMTENVTQAPSNPTVEESTESSTEEPTEEPTELPTEPAEKLELADDVHTFYHKGETIDLYCGEVELELVSWHSDNPEVAIVSGGTVVAMGRGTAKIYAEYETQQVICEIVCVADPNEPMPYVDPDILHAPVLKLPDVSEESCHYYDDAAFIGDSVSYTLSQWESMYDQLGDATFLVRGAFGLENSLTGRMKLFYRGAEVSPEQAVADSGVKKIFVMMGTNDVGRFGIEETLKLWDTFLGRILEKSPDLEIHIQSCTPIWTDAQVGNFTNELFDEYNAALEAYAEERGYGFVDVAPYFKDHTNGMAKIYCGDFFVHMSYEGTAAWAKVLKAYAAEQMQGETE